MHTPGPYFFFELTRWYSIQRFPACEKFMIALLLLNGGGGIVSAACITLQYPLQICNNSVSMIGFELARNSDVGRIWSAPTSCARIFSWYNGKNGLTLRPSVPARLSNHEPDRFMKTYRYCDNIWVWQDSRIMQAIETFYSHHSRC